MRKPRTKLTPYAIYYRDGSYMVYDLTKEDYEELTKGVYEGQPVALSVGYLVTQDIRAVILQKPKPAPAPDKLAIPDLPADQAEYVRKALEGIYDTDAEGVDYQ